ncbi:MAG: secretin N-terminal domain-containing protein [Opitutales bacterium]
MKQHLIPLIFLAVSSLVWVQAQAQNDDEIDMSDVVVIEDAEPEPTVTEEEEPSVNEEEPTVNEEEEEPTANEEEEEPTVNEEEPAAVVEIPENEVEGASVDVEAPAIPEASEELTDEDEVVLEVPGSEDQDQSPGEASMTSEETISVDFPDEDVRTILRNVADLFDLNLVIPDTLQGRTSVKLRNITWRQVFEVVLEPLGFTYVEDRNIIRIKSIEDITTEPVDTRVFVVSFARAAEIQGSIAPLIDSAAGGQIKVDSRSNALVITERPSRMNKIQEIIERLDKPTAQVMIESKFVEVTNADSKNVGVNWAFLEGYRASAGPFQRDWSRERSQATTTDSGTVDNSGFSSDQGVTFEDSTTFAEDVARVASTSRLDTAVFSASEFDVLISALNQDNDSELVANPTVVTMDNQLARIDIVREVPQIEFNFNPETGTREAQGLADPLSFGTMIEVTPQVNDAGFINLKVVPEVSNQVGIQETQLGPQPIIDVRKAETNVVIKDGFTLALGGLTQNEVQKNGTKVPVLGDLPGVGRLFRSDSDEMSQRNLIIFITARTLNPDGSTYRDVVDPRKLDEMGISPSDVPGYKVPEEQKELLQQLEGYRSDKERSEAIEEAESRIKRIKYAQEQADKERASERK